MTETSKSSMAVVISPEFVYGPNDKASDLASITVSTVRKLALSLFKIAAATGEIVVIGGAYFAVSKTPVPGVFKITLLKKLLDIHSLIKIATVIEARDIIVEEVHNILFDKSQKKLLACLVGAGAIIGAAIYFALIIYLKIKALLVVLSIAQKLLAAGVLTQGM